MFIVNQSGFQPGDSCEYQVLSIFHSIYVGFDKNPPLDVCSCFLDISKAFDKVWPEGIIYKMETTGFTGSILRCFKVTHISRCSRRICFRSPSIFDLYQQFSWRFKIYPNCLQMTYLYFPKFMILTCLPGNWAIILRK